MSRRGARVLALGWKELPAMSPARVKDIPREVLEEGLSFAGFVVISCPLKPDSKAVIKEILNASHQVNNRSTSNFVHFIHPIDFRLP